MSVENQQKIDTLFWSIAAAAFIIIGSYLVGMLAARIGRWRGVSESEQRKIFWGFFFASPWLIGFFIFVLGPSVASLYYSFTDYKLGQTPEWIGLENYRDLLAGAGRSGRRFMQSMWNSLYYAVVGVPLQLAASLLMAILLNNALKGIRVFRLIFYMPVILAGGPAILLAWRYMLSSNGGFINETLQGAARSFFLFDWLYRGFIYSVEGFNGFYIGLTRGDPIGPLSYALPALIGAIIIFMLIRGDWEPSKKQFAQRVAEVLAIIMGGLLLAAGIIAAPISLVLLMAFGLLMTAGVVINQRNKKAGTARLMQLGGLGLLGMNLVGALHMYMVYEPSPDVPTSDYLLGVIIAMLPLALTLLPRSLGQIKQGGVIIASLLVAGAIFLQVAPGQLDNNGSLIVVKYLTLQSAIEDPANLDYLEDGFGTAQISPYWLYAAVIALMAGLAWYNNRNPRVHRAIMMIGLLFFGLIATSALLDTVRYFNDYAAIEAATGRPTYHFTLFRNAVTEFPSNDRVPLWLGSELWAKPALILITMWSSGAGMLIFLAALKGVPRSLYEAAEVDGAGRWKKFTKITLPMISPAMFYNMVIGMIAALQTFETVYILQNTNNVDSLASAAYYLYQRTFQQAWIGEGAAMSWILALIIVAMTIIQFRYSNWVHYEA